jgi:hypothetical protein
MSFNDITVTPISRTVNVCDQWERINDAISDLLDAAKAHVNGSDDVHPASELDNDSGVSGSKIDNALDTLQSLIDAIETGDSNALIGVYKDVAGGVVNAYTTTITDLTLFNELFMLVRFDTPNTGPATMTLNATGTKDINTLDANGDLNDLVGGELNGWVPLIYDLSNTKYIALVSPAASSAEDSETASIIDLDTSVIAAGMTKLEIEGVTTVNLLDDDVAGCESTSGWSTAGCTIAVDSSNELEGTNCLKLTLTGSSGNADYSILSLLDTSKYYLIAGHNKNIDASTGLRIEFWSDDGTVQSNYISATSYNRVGVVIQPSDFDTATSAIIRIRIGGSSSQTGVFDAINLYEISAAEYALGADACMARHPYHRSIKGTLDRRIKCEGKNLFDKAKVTPNSRISSGSVVSFDGVAVSEYILISPSTEYYYTYDSNLHRELAFYDINKNYISNLTGSSIINWTSPSNAVYLRITAGMDALDVTQLELGSSATDYEPYKSSKANLPRILHSVPDGTADKWAVKSGVVTQNISDVYTLQSGDIESVTTGTNVQYCRIDLSAFSGIKTQAAGAVDGTTLITGLKGEVQNLDRAGDENTWNTTSAKLYIQVALGTWADLAAARTALTSTVVTQMVYALATPITHEFDSNAMNAYKSGRIIQEPAVTFFAKPSSGVITIPNSTDETYYIGHIESVQEVQDDGSLVDFEVDTNDDTTITLDTGYDDNKMYKVVYSPTFNTTLGEIIYSYPMSEPQAISNNANNISEVSKAVNNLDSLTVSWLLDHESRIVALENP